MEVNELGQVSGNPQGKKFFVNQGIVNGLTGEKISSDTHEKMMKQEANIKTDEEYQKEVDDVIQYNEDLKNVSEEYKKIKLNGNSILIRLYKHPSIRKVGSMYLPNKLVLPYQTEGGKYATMENPLQYIHKGVIHSISDQCSEQFKSKFIVGDIVHLKLGINLMQQRTWLQPEDYYNGDFDNHFIVNENMIEKGSY